MLTGRLCDQLLEPRSTARQSARLVLHNDATGEAASHRFELDGDVHNTLSLRMLSLLCGDDDRKWKDALVVAQTSLEVRIALWDGVITALDPKFN